MELSEKAFAVLDTLDSCSVFNQRQLARLAGISLGQANYILKSFLAKGFVKIGNFRKNPHKISYMYLLTPKGVQAKSRHAVKFITLKLEEYDTLRIRLAARLAAIENNAQKRVGFVGPRIVSTFIDSIIVEKKLNLILACYFKDWRDLRSVEPGSYDLVLLFDDIAGGLSTVSDTTGIPKERLAQLW